MSKMALLLETDGKIVNSRVEKVEAFRRYSKYRRKEAGGYICHTVLWLACKTRRL